MILNLLIQGKIDLSLFLGYISKNKANGLNLIISYSNKYNI